MNNTLNKNAHIIFNKLDMSKERKVILYIAQSLDGYIAKENGDVDWLVGEGKEEVLDCGYDEFLSGIDTVIMGRKTYEQVINELSPKVWPYEGKNSYVFTKSKIDEEALLEESLRDKSDDIIFVNEEFGKLYSKTKTYNEDIKFVNENVVKFIEEIKKEKGEDIWLIGGCEFIDNLMKKDLIDEYIITTIPVILGKGIPLFKEGNPEIKLKLNNVKTFDGMIMSEYSRR